MKWYTSGPLVVCLFTALTVNAQQTDWETCEPPPPLERPAVTNREAIVPVAWRPKHRNWNLDANSNYVEDSLEHLDPESVVPVTVALNQVLAGHELQWLADYGKIEYAARYAPVVFLTGVRVRDLPRLAVDARVAHVEKNRTYRWMTDRSVQNIRVQASTTYPGATFADACPGKDGSGINIAILDSGVDNPGGPGITHAGLPAAAFGFNGVTNVEIDPDDTIGHGTHVAQIALGRPNLGFRGVATGAGLIDMLVGTSAPSPIAIGRAIDKCIDKQSAWNCRVMNLSLGDCSVSSDGTLGLDVHLNNAVSAGIVVIVAMGNAGGACPAAGSVRVGSPAAADKVNLSGLSADQDFSSPDGLAFSTATGICWFQTDDGAYTDVTNCMMLAGVPGQVGDGKKVTLSYPRADGSALNVDTFVGKSATADTLKRFLVGPVGSEITGIAETPDGKALFVNIQHPGESTSSSNIADPAKYTSQWPSNAGYGAGKRPRSATIVITKNDGGRIGT